jgi:hypothetical protein
MCKFYWKFCDFGTKELNNEQWRTLKSIDQEQNELYTKKNIWFGLLGINSLTKIKETCVWRLTATYNMFISPMFIYDHRFTRKPMDFYTRKEKDNFFLIPVKILVGCCCWWDWVCKDLKLYDLDFLCFATHQKKRVKSSGMESKGSNWI